MTMECMCKKSFVSVDYDIDPTDLIIGRFLGWEYPDKTKIPTQFEMGKLYSVFEYMTLDAKYRTTEFWYSETEMRKQLRKQKIECIKRGIIIFNKYNIVDIFSFLHIINHFLVYSNMT